MRDYRDVIVIAPYCVRRERHWEDSGRWLTVGRSLGPVLQDVPNSKKTNKPAKTTPRMSDAQPTLVSVRSISSVEWRSSGPR